MKKWLPWIIGAFILGLLVLRLIYVQVTSTHDEELWYMSELDFDFSARVDSLPERGRAYLTITGGSFDPTRERTLGKKLKVHGKLRIMQRRKPYWDMWVPTSAAVGDSLYINSDKDTLHVYRGDSLIIARPLSYFLRQRPF